MLTMQSVWCMNNGHYSECMVMCCLWAGYNPILVSNYYSATGQSYMRQCACDYVRKWE